MVTTKSQIDYSGTPDILLRRLALTGMDLLLGFNVEAHPDLRSPRSSAVFDQYDAQLARTFQIVGSSWERGSTGPKRSEYAEVIANLSSDMRRHCITIGRVLRASSKEHRIGLSGLPSYLENAGLEIEALNDSIDRTVEYDPEANVDLRTGESLRDVVIEILDAARKGRKLYSRTFQVPSQFHDRLRPRNAITALQQMIPPLSSGQKRRITKWFHDQAFDDSANPAAKDFMAIYDRAVSSYENNLKNGLILGGGKGIVDITKKIPAAYHRSVTIVILNGTDKNVNWAVELTALPGIGYRLSYRFSLTEKGIKTVLMKLVKGAEEAMVGSLEEDGSEAQFNAERLSRALHSSNRVIERSFLKGTVITQVDVSGDANSLLLKVRMLRTTENPMSPDSGIKTRQLLSLHGTNLMLLGDRSSAEQLAKEVTTGSQVSPSAVLMVSSHAGGVQTYGFEFFFEFPVSYSNDKELVKILSELAWKLGKERRKDADAKKQMEEFEQQFGVSTSRRQDSSIQKSLNSRKLMERVDRMLRDDGLAIPDRYRKEMERLRWGLQNGHLKNLTDLMIVIPGRLDRAEDEFRKPNVKAHVVGESHFRIQGSLEQNLPDFEDILRRRLAAIGVEHAPSRDEVVSLLSAQALADISKYGHSSNHLMIQIPAGGVEDQRVAEYEGDGTYLTVSIIGSMIQIDNVITDERLRRPAA